MLLTLDIFLNYFNFVKINENTIKISKNDNLEHIITKQQFVDNLIITYRGNPTLKQLLIPNVPYYKNYKPIIKNENDKRYIQREQIIEYFYDIIIRNRFKYLTAFYDAYFSFEDPFTMKWTCNGGIDVLIRNGTANEYLQNEEYLNMCNIFRKGGKGMGEEGVREMLTIFDNYLNKSLNAISVQKNDNSRRIVRNLNYYDILHTTKVTNTCKSHDSFWDSLTHVYTDLVLPDRFFATSSIETFFKQKNLKCEINYNNFFYLFQQYQPKASILNPYSISYLFENYLCPRDNEDSLRLFTPVLSWSTYIISYIFSRYTEYVGIDVIPSVCEKSMFMFEYLYDLYNKNRDKYCKEYKQFNILNKHKPIIYCKPSESFLDDLDFLNRYSEYFDTIILCPPYYDMEIYKDGEQSIKLYTTYKSWCENYWEKTILMCRKVLKTSGKLSFIVNNYDTLKGESYPLINDLNLIVHKYFILENCFQLINRGSPLRMNFKERTEMLFIYKKI